MSKAKSSKTSVPARMSVTDTKTTSKPKFRIETFRSLSGDFFFRVKSANNKIVLASEGYKEKRSIDRLIQSLRDAGNFKDTPVVKSTDEGDEKVRPAR